MLQVYSIDGLTPVVAESAFVHPSAVLIGDVIVGPRCYVGPHASLRGDMGRIVMEEGSNLQDGCCMHSFPGQDAIVEANGHIGHGAVLHGCRVGRDAMVGMNSVIMDGAVIGEASIVAAMSFVKANYSIPPYSLVMGTPAKVIRELTKQEQAWKLEGTKIYHQLARRSLETMAACEPLRQIEPDRKRVSVTLFEPLYKLRGANSIDDL
jgi:phenylacetic acid degradation protein